MIDLILASASPRRKELLEQIAVKFSCSPMNINEDRHGQEGALDYVRRLAQEKALAALPQASGLAVLGSDTIVVLGDNILGKPKDSVDARQMLATLSGQSHSVITGISLCRIFNGEQQILNEVVTTQVTFEPLTHEQIAAYVETGESLDKAGSYGIQGKAAAFIKSIQGSYSNVVGLPLYETSKLLAAFDVPIWTD
jgi:septum formation protein